MARRVPRFPIVSIIGNKHRWKGGPSNTEPLIQALRNSIARIGDQLAIMISGRPDGYVAKELKALAPQIKAAGFELGEPISLGISRRESLGKGLRHRRKIRQLKRYMGGAKHISTISVTRTAMVLFVGGSITGVLAMVHLSGGLFES